MLVTVTVEADMIILDMFECVWRLFCGRRWLIVFVGEVLWYDATPLEVPCLDVAKQ